MSQLQRKPMSTDEFLAWESKQEFKWEFDGFQPVAMTGGTIAHSLIQGNLITALNNRTRGKSCRAYGSDLKVEIGPKYRYPDVFVSCSRSAPNLMVGVDPVVVFEILSESTARTDRTTKLLEYQSLPSVQRYILIEQDQEVATVVTRTGSGWSLEVLDAGGTLTMPEIGVEVAMSELYEGLELTPLEE